MFSDGRRGKEKVECPTLECPFTLMRLARVDHLGTLKIRRMGKDSPPMAMELETSEQVCCPSQCPRGGEKALLIRNQRTFLGLEMEDWKISGLEMGASSPQEISLTCCSLSQLARNECMV